MDVRRAALFFFLVGCGHWLPCPGLDFALLWDSPPLRLQFRGSHSRRLQVYPDIRSRTVMFAEQPVDDVPAADVSGKLLEPLPSAISIEPPSLAGQGQISADASKDAMSRNLAIQTGLFACWGWLLFNLVTAETNPVYRAKVRDTISSAVPRGGLKVLEIGIGEAPNLEFYPSGTKLVGLDASLPGIGQQLELKSKARKDGISLFFAEGDIEQLPFKPESFDAVIMTKVLCSVTNPLGALREVSRVLVPGGRLGYVEHVAADEGSLLEKQQFLVDPVQQLIAGNCHLHRDTDGLISNAVSGAGGTEKLFSSLEGNAHYQVWQMWPIVEQVSGVATK